VTTWSSTFLDGVDVLHAIPGIHARSALLGPELERVDDVWLTFADGLITDVRQGPGPPGLLEVDGVLAPGLIDCHVHLAMSGSADVVAELAALSPARLRAVVAGNARAQLRSGVTTVRDLGSPRDVVLDMAAELSGALESPTVVAAGAISSPTGHGNFLARHAEGPEGYAAAVRAVADAGARVVKLFATGGVITAGTAPGGVQMSPEELVAAVRVARERGLQVAAHAHAGVGIGNVLRAGVDSVEHFSYLDDATVDLARGGPAWLVSTLVATRRFVESDGRDRATPETLSKIVAHAPVETASLTRAVAAGCRLAVGTDAGTTLNPHGGAMQEQAVHLRAAGLPDRAALRAMTVEGARLLREPAGWLEAGRRADVIVVADDPGDDVRRLGSIRHVICRGLLAAPESPTPS
jgi:imidazolonepropionase-like amidohydrolase